MSSLIVINFKLSVVVTLVGCAAILLGNFQNFPESNSYLGAQAGYALFAPGIIGLLTAISWFTLYRHGDGHTFSFFAGLSLLLPVVGSRISEELVGPYYSGREQLFLLYTGISHIAYALLNWQDLVKALGSDAD
jgi:hypothetical protein